MSKTFFPKLSTARWRTSYLGSYGDKERISSIFLSWLFLLPCIFIIIACDFSAVSTNSDNAGEPKSPWAPNITSMEPVTFTLKPKKDGQPIKLQIPKAYLYRPETLYGGSPDVIYVQTGLPDLTPQKRIFSIPENLASERRIHALEKLKNGINLHIFNKRFRDYYWDKVHQRLKSYELKNNDYYGLLFFWQAKRGEHCFKENYFDETLAGKCFSNGREHYFAKKYDGKNSIYISCYPKEMNLGCTANTNMSGLKAKLIFQRSELLRWRQFISGARKLIKSFVKN